MAIRRRKDILKAVIRTRPLESFVLRHQVQIMVAEHYDRAIAKRAHEAQDFERFRPAVDEIADKPQAVGVAEPYLIEQRAQLIEAALHVADREGRHRS